MQTVNRRPVHVIDGRLAFLLSFASVMNLVYISLGLKWSNTKLGRWEGEYILIEGAEHS